MSLRSQHRFTLGAFALLLTACSLVGGGSEQGFSPGSRGNDAKVKADFARAGSTQRVDSLLFSFAEAEELAPDDTVPTSQPLSWVQARLAADRRTVLLGFVMGPAECWAIGEPDVDESAEQVRIALSQGTRPGAGPCGESAGHYVTAVRLAEPLGGRPLVEATSGAKLRLTPARAKAVPFD